MPSTIIQSRSSGSRNVCATEMGSETPLVSTMIYSGLSGRSIRLAAALSSRREWCSKYNRWRDDGVAFHADDKLSVDVDRAEVVDQYRDAQTLIVVQDIVEQCCFARAQKAAQDRHPERGRFSTVMSSSYCLCNHLVCRGAPFLPNAHPPSWAKRFQLSYTMAQS